MNSQQYEAWKVIIGQLGPRYSEIIVAMTELNGFATLAELSVKTGREFHQLSRRITELREKRIITDSGHTRVNPASLRKLTLWRLDTERVNRYLQGER